jgi:hypothetical protein
MMLGLLNYVNCPCISLPKNFYSAQGKADSAGPFWMVQLAKRMRLTMLCGWQMSQMFSRLNIGVDLELFPIANLVDVYLKKILMLFRHLARKPGIYTGRDLCFATSAI